MHSKWHVCPHHSPDIDPNVVLARLRQHYVTPPEHRRHIRRRPGFALALDLSGQGGNLPVFAVFTSMHQVCLNNQHLKIVLLIQLN